MDSKKPNIGEQYPDDGAGKKKPKKNRNQGGQQDAPPQQQHKGQGQHPKQRKEEKADFPQLSKNIEPSAKQQPVQTQDESMKTKQPAQMQDQPTVTKHQPAQKEDQSKITNQPVQKQPSAKQQPVQTQGQSKKAKQQASLMEDQSQQAKQQPVQTKDQSKKTKQQPDQMQDQPTVVKQKPVKKQDQPAQKEDQSTITRELPVQKQPSAKQQPVQTQGQSKKAKQQASLKEDQSQPAKQQPVQTQDQSKKTKQKSVQKQDQPAQKEDQSKITKQQPVKKQQSAKQQPAQKEDEPQQDSPTEKTISHLKANLNIPKRKNLQSGGTLGRKTTIEVNHLPLNLDKLFKKTVYHMDVLFQPDLPRNLLRTALEEFNQRHYPRVGLAFDGRKNMYSTKELKGISDVVSIVNENGRPIDFTITTTVVNIIDMSKIQEYIRCGSSNKPPGEAFQALDIVLKNRPFALRFTNVGRSFFPVPRMGCVDLGEGMELWKGFFQSPVIGWKPYLNIDVAHKGFPKHQPLVTYIKEDLRCELHSELDNRSLNTLTAYVRGLKVEFMIPNQPNTKRTFKVVGVLDIAGRYEFDMDDPTRGLQRITVAQYFQRYRNYVVKYPRLPCLHVGNVLKKTAIPIELCTVIRGQIRLKKLTENQTANMVRNSARPPAERKQTIENSIRNINYNSDNVLREFGIEVNEKFASVPARVLDQPSLAYFQKETKPRLGVWKAEKFSTAVQLKKWIVLNLDQRTRRDSILGFEQALIRCGKDTNVIVQPKIDIVNCFIERHWQSRDIQRAITNIFNQAKKDNIELIVVVIPDFPPGVYATVKQTSELQVGVLTQCIRSKTMFKMNPSTAGNILLKINSKLNGVNHTLATKSSPPCMKDAIIFGADVTHPSPDQTSIPSVAAVAASHDIYGSQYNMEWRLQSPKVEIIQDLEDIVHKQLLKFKERTKCVPKKIFYFRDGVSEGQFLQLLEHELVAIRRACLRLNPNYKPAVTFLVVQKRHHTRMFPIEKADMDGKFQNVPSGTIIDTQITHPTELDFYLCSHASIQGTSRPTKYHLIWDDNNLTEDVLEQLTFYLCFMFARCTRSVSYPAPTYYAHLAAFRARTYIENKPINIDRLEHEQINNALNQMFTQNTPMFFV